ncbi:MAG TPA: PBP1A family penicillin-binding protein [Gemmatimonadaceae bacterium]|nr:PBP1A family penicillin-binding protein [Gemmatimonadaceae bacterium]
MLNDFRRNHPKATRALALVAIFIGTFGFGFLYASWALVCRAGQCPSIDVLDSYTPRQTSKLYAADGRFIAEIGLERRTLVRLSEIPDVVKKAFLAIEDKRFYGHAGIDWIRLAGALAADIRTRSFSQGFSTITMQLARNVFPERISREKTLVRKLKEAKVARAIERRYSKDKILELYLNQIYLGNGAYGVETAAQRYFGKSVRDLNLAEAALLAGLPKAPGRYDPRRNPDRAVTRRNTIVELMRRDEAISNADASLAKAYPLELARRSESGDIAPYYVEWVRRQLDEQFGQQLYEQGLKVYTTLDLDMQSAAERALESQLRAIESGKFGRYQHVTYEQYEARAASANEDDDVRAESPYLQGAFVAIDPRSGAVRALVGGRDFDDSKFNRATQALRQPGSTFKPLVYATAVQSGRPPSFMLDDAPIAIPQLDSTTWTPQNYDLKFEGWMTMRRGLYLSRNIVAIRAGMDIGEPAVIGMAHRFGLTTPIPPYPSIHIGAADVYPIEMVASYTTFATLGTRAAPTAILRVESADGGVLWEPQPVRAQVLSPDEAWLMVDMMKDVVRRGTAYGAVWGAGFQIPAAGKTGTTNDGTDVWYIGYTADLVAGVWMGLDRPRKIKSNAQGGELAAPAWTTFMTEVYRRKPAPPDWPRPENIAMREIDRTTGLLRNPFCPADVVYTEFYIPGTEPVRECDAHSPFLVPADSTAFSPMDTNGVRTRPGAVPIPRPSQPTLPAPPRDTANPFYIPPE